MDARQRRAMRETHLLVPTAEHCVELAPTPSACESFVRNRRFGDAHRAARPDLRTYRQWKRTTATDVRKADSLRCRHLEHAAQKIPGKINKRGSFSVKSVEYPFFILLQLSSIERPHSILSYLSNVTMNVTITSHTQQRASSKECREMDTQPRVP